MKRKRHDLDLANLQDFCFHGAIIEEKDYSCARVDAVLIRNKDSRSHLKGLRFHNIRRWLAGDGLFEFCTVATSVVFRFFGVHHFANFEKHHRDNLYYNNFRKFLTYRNYRTGNLCRLHVSLLPY